MRNYKIHLIILLLLTGTVSWADSITWQKLALEEKLQRRYSSILSTQLKDNQYLVEIETSITDPGGPNFDPSGHRSGSRVSDIDISQSRGDYIAFSKMGLEVPVLEKFLDEDRTKLMNLYRYNEAFDLFKNITGVKVNIFLSDKLPEELIEIVKGIVQSSKINIEGVKPTFNFSTLKMEWVDPSIAEKELAQKDEPKVEQPKEEVEPKIWAKDWLEWASRWGNAFGMILGAIIVGLIAVRLFRQWSSFMEKHSAKSQLENKNENIDEATAENSGESQEQNSKLQEDEVASIQGFERFQQCLGQQPSEAINMLRNWINESEEKHKLILQGVSQQATSEQMEVLMSGLSEFQRDQWRELIGKHLESKDLAEANKLLFYEVIKAFLVPTKIKDGELLNLIMELNSSSTIEFLNAHPGQIGILMNILSPGVINGILAKVNDATADRWLLEGAKFQATSLESGIPALKAALQSFKEANAPSPFVQRIVSMISTADASREATLYRALAKASTTDMVIETAKKNFPGELVMRLPGTLLKEVIQSFPMAKRVEIILSRPTEDQNALISYIAEKGTPARDLIDMEIENIEKNNTLKASIESRKNHIWTDFVVTLRTTLSKNPSYDSFKEELIKEWSKKLGKELHAIKGDKVA